MDRKLKIYNFIKDFWNIIKKYIDVPADKEDAAWMTILNESEDLSWKYKSKDPEGIFIKDCITAWMKYLNNRNLENMGRGLKE